MKVIVTPKAAVLDPQGAAVREAMQHLGMPGVGEGRVGKYSEIEVGKGGAGVRGGGKGNWSGGGGRGGGVQNDDTKGEQEHEPPQGEWNGREG